jgi:hypothetical protein
MIVLVQLVRQPPCDEFSSRRFAERDGHATVSYIQSENEKSRRNRTPLVFHCVGLLLNGSSGRWLDYPLFSHPRLSHFRRELILVSSPGKPLYSASPNKSIAANTVTN